MIARERDPGGPIPRRHLFGLDFVDLPDLTLLLDELATNAPALNVDGLLPVVVTPNVDHLVKLDAGVDAVAADVVHRAAYVLPDGQPVVWASTLLGKPLRGRLTGSGLVHDLWPRLCADRRPVVVVASSPQIARFVEADNPRAIAIVAPVISLTERTELDRLIDRCARACHDHGPSHLFVTLGFPKQCNIIDGVLTRLAEEGTPPPMCLAVGASFDMYYGTVRRAPALMQRIGLEWCFRFVQEPRRLFRRYFVEDLRFVGLVWRERASKRRGSD